MKYLVLSFTVILATIGSILLKFYERYNEKSLYISMRFTAISSFIASFMFVALDKFNLRMGWISLVIGLVMGLQTFINVPAQLKAFSLGSVAITIVSGMLGQLIGPFIYGIVFLHEAITWQKGIGLVTIIITICLLLPSKSEKGKVSAKFLLLCLVIFIINAIFFILMKVHTIVGDATENGLMCIVYGIMAVLGFVFCLVIRLRDKEFSLPKLNGKQITRNISLVTVYGVSNSLSNLLSLVCSSFFPASIQFPIVSGGSIIASSLSSWLIFGEKINLKTAIMLIFAVISIILFSI